MSTAPAAPAPVVEDPEAKRRKRLAALTVRNMVFSMLAVLAIVMAWWSLTFNPEESQRRAPETTATTAYAAQEATWPLWAPDPGEGWTPTVVWYDLLEQVPTWHISYVSPQGEYAALHQASDVTDPWLAAVLGETSEVGEVSLTGPSGEASWVSYQGREGGNAERAYVLGPQESGGSTVVLHGTASLEELEALLASVEARD